MKAYSPFYIRLFFTSLLVLIFSPKIKAEILYVDSLNGRDTNPGTQDKPLKCIQKAAELVNSSSDPGPTTIEISTGVYCLEECITFFNKRLYTQENRLTIKASILPDDPNWTPALMPIILSSEDPRKPENLNAHTETFSIKVQINHVTIQGLKFLGNPLSNNWHACIERVGKNMDDLVITQCMFVGDNDGMNIYCPALATGDRFVVDHCIFKNCHASAVFWDGPGGISGKNCAMRYCIVDGAYISGVWTCQTAEDFEFHHNVITNGEYFWMRKRGDRQKYRIDNCVIIGNKYFSGYGTAAGPTGQTGQDVSFEENGIIKKGVVHFEIDKKSRGYMHVPKGSIGNELGAGLFKKNSN